MEDMEILTDLKKLIKKELRKNVEKGTLSPQEIDSVNKAVDSLEKIAKTEQICNELDAAKKNPDMYSGAFYNIRNFPQMPPPMSYNSYGNYMPPNWDSASNRNMDSDWSGERGRNMHTGRFTSRDNYSGHSINDRMVDQLEKMMDSANSEFERQQILDKIKMIRNSSDHIG